jgi:hypothetical protein
MSHPVPYYQDEAVCIYHGDCREVLPQIQAEAIITDPVWPGCEHVFPGIDAEALLRDALAVARVERVAIHLGCWSDVRFLRAVPARFPFIRVCWLEYACPSYRGRVLNTGDVAYVFGEPPAPRKGAMVLPGKSVAHKTDRGWVGGKRAAGKERSGLLNLNSLPHPTPRRTEHVRWLVGWFGGASVIDPFMGTGATLVAAKSIGVKAIGIERERAYCDLAVERLRQATLPLEFTA